MKNINLGILLIIITILAIVFNIRSFANGGYSSLFGSLMSFAFIAIWVLAFRYALKNKEYNLIFLSTVFWSLTCLTTLVVIYINITEVDMSFMIPFAVIFLTPLNGLDFIGTNNIIDLAIILFIASCFSYFGSRFIIRNNK